MDLTRGERTFLSFLCSILVRMPHHYERFFEVAMEEAKQLEPVINHFQARFDDAIEKHGITRKAFETVITELDYPLDEILKDSMPVLKIC